MQASGITITRRQIARQAIDTAIDLFFRRNAPVNAHVLACAALDQLKGVATDREIQILHTQLQERDGKKESDGYNSFIRPPYNFFKHSDRDPDSVLTDFYPEQTFVPLLFACEAYERIYSQVSWSMYVLNRWVVCRNPDLMKPECREGMAVVCNLMECDRGVEFEESTQKALSLLAAGCEFADLIPKEIKHIIET